MSEHLCQFFDSDESRAKAVSAFIAQGLRLNEQLVVIARPVHWAAIIDRLESANVPASRELASGRLIVKDAMDSLRRLSSGGRPSAELFDQVIGAPVRVLSASRRVRAYGETVDILAQRGDLHAALELEALWNGLAESCSLSLMCGYSAAYFVAPGTHTALRGICAAHTLVRCDDQDALGNWLLNTAHTPIVSSISPSR
jgi:hypothetical protein